MTAEKRWIYINDFTMDEDENKKKNYVIRIKKVLYQKSNEKEKDKKKKFSIYFQRFIDTQSNKGNNFSFKTIFLVAHIYSVPEIFY